MSSKKKQQKNQKGVKTEVSEEKEEEERLSVLICDLVAAAIRQIERGLSTVRPAVQSKPANSI